MSNVADALFGYDAGQTRIDVRGAMDADGVARLRPQLEAAAAAAPERLELDMSRVDMIDGSGLGAIAFLFKRLAAAGGRLVLTGVTGQPLAMLKDLGLAEMLVAAPVSPRAARRRAGAGAFAWA